jgi:predicted dehydrogenase
MIRIGVIGAGPNGTGNAAGLAKHADRCRIVAVADIDPAAGRKLATAHGAQFYTDYRQLLNWVDAVVISTPNDLHAEMAVAAAGAGKHVWIEKPMALSLTQADRIVTAVQAAGVASLVGFSVRFDGVVRRMKEVFASGRLGELLSIWSRRLCFFDPATVTPWRLEYARSGGVMSELIVHEIDWIVDIAGEPTGVFCRKASRKQDDRRDNDHLWITLAFGKGASGSIEGSQMSLIADYYRGVVGTAGSAATRHWGGELYLQTDPKTATKLEPLPAFDKHEHFLDVIDGRCPSVADARYGHRIVRISEKAIKSAMTGQAVEL